MRSLLFHILLFLFVIILVALYLYSERLREGLQLMDSSSSLPMNSDPSNQELTNQQQLTIQLNVVLAIKYIVMYVLENKVPFYTSDMTMQFCSAKGVLTSTCGPITGDSIKCDNIDSDMVKKIVDETLLDPKPKTQVTTQPNSTSIPYPYNDLQVRYVTNLKNAFSDLLNQTLSKGNYKQTYDICKVCDITYKTACEQIDLTKDYYKEDNIEKAAKDLIKEVGSDSLTTVGDLADYIQAVEKKVIKEFVPVFFPTNTFGYDRLVYYNYFVSVHDKVVEAIQEMFTNVNMTNYINSTIPKDVVIGSLPEYIVEKGDPGTIFSFPLQKDYHSDPSLGKLSPRSHCKSGQFHSILNPQNGMGDEVHYVCD
jgi:hypothetical protein